jgi:hypothetical protein
MRKFLPLILIEGYLLSTLAVFCFGPVSYKVHNPGLFVMLMALCHGFFAFGYFLAWKVKGKRVPSGREEVFSDRSFWLLFFFGIIGIWASYKNLMLFDGIIPRHFFTDLARGFREPGLVYVERGLMAEDGVAGGSRVFNVVSLFFAFAKLLFVFYFIFFWDSLNWIKKAVAASYSFLFLAPGISSGVNSVIFIFFLFSAISLVCVMYVRRNPKFKLVVGCMALLFLVPVAWFGTLMTERGGGFENLAGSPLGDISVVAPTWSDPDSSIFGFFYYSFVWLSYYVCQGYYGLSLALGLDWQWTYGFGNSAFLQRQLAILTGVDVSAMTFQARVDHLWDETAQWHSFYAQVANDVGIPGLPILLFLIGFFFARVWRSVLVGGSFFGLALMPIFIIMFVFFPANNQVFGYIDTLSYSVFVTLFWLFKSNPRVK